MSASTTPSAAGLRLLAATNGLLYAPPVGLATLFGVSALAEALGHATGMETLYLAIMTALATVAVATALGVAIAIRFETSEDLSGALRSLWRWQAISLPVIVLVMTGVQLQMKPLPA